MSLPHRAPTLPGDEGICRQLRRSNSASRRNPDPAHMKVSWAAEWVAGSNRSIQSQDRGSHVDLDQAAALSR